MDKFQEPISIKNLHKNRPNNNRNLKSSISPTKFNKIFTEDIYKQRVDARQKKFRV